jgi:N6-L-threonylcarbamoyladenine synthase
MILAFESSCDETALAVFDPSRGLLRELVNSQIALHGRYGGVVPDLATREHLRNFPLLLERLREGDGLAAVTRVVVTQGPGLAGCLAIGLAAAKALALERCLPLWGVNHLRGHAWSPFIALHAEAPAEFDARLEKLLPHLGLIVSGGNTLLFAVDRARRISVLSSTRDDAAGEALDKGAKLLGLGYPGSFSGLKTSLRYLVEKMGPEEVTTRLDDLCASYQQAVIDALVKKASAAFDRGGYASLGLSGGVSNNRTLRTALEKAARQRGAAFRPALPQHTGDNAGMIAFAAWCDPEGCARDDGLRLRIQPGLALG